MNQRLSIKVALVRESARLPEYGSAGAAGADLYAAFDGHPVKLKPGARAQIATGVVLELPDGIEAQIRSRSGLAAKHGIVVFNSPGTIDSDYRGELIVILLNTSSKSFTINSGDRIAQLVIAPVIRAEFAHTKEVENTARGTFGFGSTGN